MLGRIRAGGWLTVLEMGISVTWICMWVGSMGADGERRCLKVIFAITEYAQVFGGDFVEPWSLITSHSPPDVSPAIQCKRRA
jgi:hypothetical protein